MDDEKKIILLKTYQEYHSNNEAGITEELLVEQGRDLLSSQSVEPNNRFLALDIDVYRNVLGNIAAKFENNEESINKMKTGFNSLEKYAINLWKFPWRKEYHSIKLYTAFFKCNVQNQLQDLDTILFILKSLGYKKTGQHQDQVTVKEPDFERAIRVSLDLFLIQVDLQMIKEIMEHLSDSKLSLRQLVKARSRTYDVKEACNLWRRIAKRQKLEAPQESEAASHKQVPSGKINSTRDDKLVVAHAVQSTRSDSKDSIMSNTTEARAMNTSFTGSVGNKGDPSADMPTTNKDDISRRRVLKPAQFGNHFSDRDLYGFDPAGSQPGETRRNRLDAHGSALTQTRFPHSSDVSKSTFDAAAGGSYSLSYLGTMTQSRHGHQHFTQSHANFEGGDLQGINVDTQSYPVQLATRNTADTAATKLNGSSGSDRHGNLRDIRSLANHPQSADTTWRNDTNVVAEYRGISVSEPMEVEQTGRNQGMQNNITPLLNGMAEGAHARPTFRPGVGDLNTTLEHGLTLAPKPQRFGHASNEQRKPYDSQKYTGEKDATRFHDRTTSEHSSKSSIHVENMKISGGDVAREGGSNAADLRGFSADKIDVKGTSPHPLGRQEGYKPNSAHTTSSHHRAAEVQYPARNSQISQYSGGASNDMMASQAEKLQQKNPNEICEMCESDGTSICRNCYKFVCDKCKEIYNTDLCSVTKAQHIFKELKKSSADENTLSSQNGATVNEGMVDDGKKWPCSRCTYLNPPEYKICSMCASSRGFSSVDQTEVGSRVCRNCTFHNKQGTAVCKACDKTLDLTGPHESVV